MITPHYLYTFDLAWRLAGASISAARVLCDCPEAEVSEEFCEGGRLVMGVEAARVGENPGVAPAEGGFLEADATVKAIRKVITAKP